MRTFRLFYFSLVALLCVGFVSCSDDEEIERSSQKQILEFSVDDLKAEINESEKTIALTLPAGTDITKLKPVVKVSDKASISPASEAETDFTNPVVYTVTAEDGSTQAYTVTIDVIKLIPFLVKKITVKSNEGSGYIAFTYNEDNTLAKYTGFTNKDVEFANYLFTYDSQKRLTEVKVYDNDALDYVYTYKYLDNNKVEMLEVITDQDPAVPNNPYIYNLNDKGFPVKMEQKGYTFHVDKEDGGSYGGSGPTTTKTFEYNADNTFKKITEVFFYEFNEEPYTHIATHDFKYDTDTYHPLHNLPAGNLYLYDHMILEHSINITGNGAFAGNCTDYTLKSHYLDNYSVAYEYGEHKFPIKASLTVTETSSNEETEIYNYELTFEYIEK